MAKKAAKKSKPVEKPNWEPITIAELNELGRRIDFKYVIAKASSHCKRGFTGPSEPLYAELAKLRGKWVSIGGPILHGGELIMVMLKPRTE